MSHDENAFNVTGFPFMEVSTNHPYGPTYNPLPPEICSEVCIHPSIPQSERWLTGCLSSTVTPSPWPSSRYRKIRPRPARTSPAPGSKNEDIQLDQRPTKKARRTQYRVTGTINQPARRNQTRYAWPVPPTLFTLAN
ncbi:hypothetical protein PDIG_35730 [Penicillium digitatum PHI26]|uniref:Uncharacterized protein n=2 Tax=Penicillium digitatum TaxID=36651 RepID=K9FXK1_PEND2|nr:hypothetical protein PDIP_05740 [Penicillium digitatum Pd1]EKV13829.1 hypothetical protein PDIG_35730 [Penicillium digitatum PHI26]EKV21514.1 hypothetical protein PDIP_05740 [Penicillium digitatum Pd1]